MPIDPKVLTRVKALLSQAQSTPYPEEAEAFSAKAAAMIDQYRIDLADLQEAGHTGPVFGTATYPLTGVKSLRASLTLLSVLGTHFGTVVITPSTGNSKNPVLAGTQEDIEATVLMFESLVIQRDTACGREPVPYGVATVTFRNSFAYGYAVRIHERLTALRNRQRAEATAASSSTALALFDRKDAVTRWAQQAGECGGGSVNRNRPSVNGRGYRSGEAAADRADLGQSRVGATTGARALGSGS